MPIIRRLMMPIAVILLVAACGQKTTQDLTHDAAELDASPKKPAVREPEARPFPTATLNEQSLRDRIATLSADELEGRAPATSGGKKTREYLINEMQEIGLEPGNGDSYEQITPLIEITADPKRSSFSVNGTALSYGDEIVFWTKRVEEDISFHDSDIVFVGYGIVAPEYGWNDYEGIDVAGKTVVILVNDPGYATEDPNLFNGRSMTYYGRWTYKYEEAARQGAAAAIIIHQTAPASYGWGVVEGGWTGPQLDLKRVDGGASRVPMEGWVQASVAENLFAQAGLNLDDQVTAAARPGFRPLKLKGLKADGKIKNIIRESQSANVAGVLRGAKSPDEYVLYMAHWDHLGRNFSSSNDNIANGAVDNATGTAGILSIAEGFAKNGTPPDRSILFIAVTAEESGLLGSAYFADDPIVPLGNIVGGVNVDALLPTPPAKDLMVIGNGASELEDILKVAADKRGLYLRADSSPESGFFYRSDHISLAKTGVPMLYAKNGVDLVEGGEDAGIAFQEDYRVARYHKPADEYDSNWDIRAVTQTFEVLYEVGATMAYTDYWPNWYDGNEFRALRDEQRANVSSAN
ncbi:MAG: M20/M25/M40 family metallo-hydrolase [Pseudomonadota bacterium]